VSDWDWDKPNFTNPPPSPGPRRCTPHERIVGTRCLISDGVQRRGPGQSESPRAVEPRASATGQACCRTASISDRTARTTYATGRYNDPMPATPSGIDAIAPWRADPAAYYNYEFGYDGLGRRVWTQENSGNGSWFIYDGDQLVQERDFRSDSLIVEYAWGPTTGAPAIFYQNRIVDGDPQERWIYTSPQGGFPRHLFSDTGAITDTFQYSSFGELVFHDGDTQVDFGWKGDFQPAGNALLPQFAITSKGNGYIPVLNAELSKRSFVSIFLSPLLPVQTSMNPSVLWAPPGIGPGPQPAEPPEGGESGNPGWGFTDLFRKPSFTGKCMAIIVPRIAKCHVVVGHCQNQGLNGNPTDDYVCGGTKMIVTALIPCYSDAPCQGPHILNAGDEIPVDMCDLEECWKLSTGSAGDKIGPGFLLCPSPLDPGSLIPADSNYWTNPGSSTYRCSNAIVTIPVSAGSSGSITPI